MIINKHIENLPVLSNVDQVGEFKIRNSAKAFSILSSGLYSNKIRAIVREYSCNAVDSHVEANKANVPFDVHLPNRIEPWFAVRDYGVGLDENQVRNIYTTYFDSTKNSSDDFIGGLGLGSKSAFSYTDNFTIVAIKHGIKNVFTAFINDNGVPSIATMASEPTTDPAGVEIKFAVHTNDFYAFEREAKSVYKYFKLRPVIVNAPEHFQIDRVAYDMENIIPGVHYENSSNTYNACCKAVMGNIEYPIQLPQNTEKYSHLLSEPFVLEFAIGELDIQASREHLSYIPQTVAVINKKLELLDDHIKKLYETSVNRYTNNWEKVIFLRENQQFSSRIHTFYCRPYLTNLETEYQVSVQRLLETYNIDIQGFITRNGYSRSQIERIKPMWDDNYRFPVTRKATFIVNKTMKKGYVNRCKNYYKDSSKHSHYFYILSRHDESKEMDLDSFFKDIGTPLETMIEDIDSLPKVIPLPRIPSENKIMKLEQALVGNKTRLSWVKDKPLEEYDTNTTYYYLRLKNSTTLGLEKRNCDTFVHYINMLSQTVMPGIIMQNIPYNSSTIYNGKVYGVRGALLDEVEEMPNWVDLDSFVKEKLKNVNFDFYLIKQALSTTVNVFRKSINDRISSSDSPYKKLYNQLIDITKHNSNTTMPDMRYDYLCELRDWYEITDLEHNKKVIENVESILCELNKTYPLLSLLLSTYTSLNIDRELAQYISAIDMLNA